METHVVNCQVLVDSIKNIQHFIKGALMMVEDTDSDAPEILKTISGMLGEAMKKAGVKEVV